MQPVDRWVGLEKPRSTPSSLQAGVLISESNLNKTSFFSSSRRFQVRVQWPRLTEMSAGMISSSPGVVPLRNMFDGMCCTAPVSKIVPRDKCRGIVDQARTGMCLLADRARMFVLACSAGLYGAPALSPRLSLSLSLSHSLSFSRSDSLSLSLSLSLTHTNRTTASYSQ